MHIAFSYHFVDFAFVFRCSPSKFTLHVIVSDSHQLSALNLLDNAFNLITGHVHIDYVLVSTLFTTDKLQLQLPSSKIKVSNLILKYPLEDENKIKRLKFRKFLINKLCRLFMPLNYSITFRRSVRQKYATGRMFTIRRCGESFS